MPQRTALILLCLTALALPPRGRAQATELQVRLRAAAEALLEQRHPGHAGRLRVRVRRTGGEIHAPLRLDFPSTGRVPRGMTQVQVRTRHAGGWKKTGWALLYVAHFDSVAVARHDLRRGAAVTADNLTLSWMETTRFRGNPLRGAEAHALLAAGNVFTTRPLRAGRALRQGDLRPPYVADAGDVVTMHYRRGRIVLRIPCEARESGFAHETIRLYSPATRSLYRARLTGPGTAEWIETL